MANYPYDEVGTKLDRTFAATLNKNFDEIEDDIRQLVETVGPILDDSFDSAALAAEFEERLNNEIQKLQPDWVEFKQNTTAQLAEKAEQEEVSSLQGQIDTLVLGASDPNATNAQITQALVSSTGKTSETLKGHLDDIEKRILDGEVALPLNWINGSVSDSGVPVAPESDGRRWVDTHTDITQIGPNYFGVSPVLEKQVIIFCFDSNGNFVKKWTVNGGSKQVFHNDYASYRFYLRKDGGTVNASPTNSNSLANVFEDSTNAEIRKARKDSNGIEHKSLKEAMDTKATKEEIYQYELPLGETTLNAYVNVDGRIITGAYATDNGLSATDFIRVVKGYQITIVGGVYSYDLSTATYDQLKNPVGHIANDAPTFTVGDYSYVRFTYREANKENVRIYYSAEKPLIFEGGSGGEEPMMTELLSKGRISAENFLKTAAHKPILVWVDDDTEYSKLSGMKTVCDNLGIKATLGCITEKLTTEPLLEELLLSYQNEGFHITTHSHTHTNIWRQGSPEYSVAEMEKDLITSLIELKKRGFLDSDYFVSPFGNNSTEARKMAKKWCRCLVKANGSASYNTLTNSVREGIERTFIYANQQTVEYYTAMIDEAFNNGDMLVLGTHSGHSQEWNADFVTSIFAYAQQKGMEIMTLNEAMKQRKALYDLRESFS